MSYTTAHNRLVRTRGRASEHACIFCEAPAEDWSYDHLDPDEKVEYRNGDRPYPYSEDPARYQPLCRPCHVYRDKGYEDWNSCLACGRPTIYSYCLKHRVGPKRLPGMQYGYRQAVIDEFSRKRRRRNADLVARAFVKSQMTHKRCTVCLDTLSVDSFGVIKSRIERPDPYRSICLACDREKGLAKYRAKTGRTD